MKLQIAICCLVLLLSSQALAREWTRRRVHDVVCAQWQLVHVPAGSFS